ncbi:Aromatic amino acid lyase [Dethiosulfatibacter aminovorans DSM 17477]|uniref:Aromatic amino acid lyase n=1 Tax=Dethiosulfatibacter aminovorans DSM 17477 TaxID=1121476 RepID=A0A1M6AB41_9FIRM|nr:aromatic amino acid lyase [Dethiosulfatibacter aminovorans]SHI33712.1 Aromatic amino acid lyase [Dethiosulfatibacter aminovorans DSM 17477]
MDKLYINGYDLTVEDVMKALNEDIEVILDEKAREMCKDSRSQIDRWLEGDPPVIYGINTGLGNMKDTVLSPEEHKRWNKTIPYPHAVALGKAIEPEITRASLLLRANVLARSYSAVRVELIERLLELFNSGLSPVVYELGSTGLSDLSPLSQNTMFVAGLEEAKAFSDGTMTSAREAFKKAGIEETFDLECKEVLALMNGSTMTQAIAILTFNKLERIFDDMSSDIEKTEATLYHSLKNSMNLIKLNLNKENNVSCDNPLLFKTDGNNYEPVMGCNCSNTQIGYMMDLVTVLVSDMCKWMYRNNSHEDKSYVLNIINKLDQLVMPATADSITTKTSQEDHVEFSYGAARKAKRSVELLEKAL